MEQSMEITFLGVGNALHNEKGIYHSNLMVKCGEHTLFIDCGSDFPHALADADLSYRDISHVYISHVHADHAGGLEWLGFSNYFDPEANKIRLYYSSEIAGDLDTMLKVSMHPSIKNMAEEGLAACFDITHTDPGFDIGAMHCIPIKTLQVGNYDKLYSYGLFITAGDKSILFTSDTQYNPDVFMKYYEKADIILHDCTTNGVSSAVHASLDQLTQLPETIKNKMYLYHYSFGHKPDITALGFKGYAQQRQPISV